MIQRVPPLCSALLLSMDACVCACVCVCCRFATVMKIVRLFTSLILICHWIGSFWFFIGEEAPEPCDNWPQFGGYNDSVTTMQWHRVYKEKPGINYCSWLTIADIGTCPERCSIQRPRTR